MTKTTKEVTPTPPPTPPEPTPDPEPDPEPPTETTTTTTSRRTTTEEVKGDEIIIKVHDNFNIWPIIIAILAGLGLIGLLIWLIPFLLRKTVLVAMGGGISSAVAAKILQERQYKVYGLFINNGVNLVNLSEAQKICNNLDIKLYEKDLDTNYKDELSKFITSELNIGVIPDIELIYNKLVLIGMLKEVAKEKHIKYISTGLFAQVQDNKLINAIDSTHDETYKLSRISEEEIKKLVLPIGEIDNIQVERMAENNNIKSSISNTTIVEKLGEGNIRDILSKVIVNEPGNIVDIGTNQTIGNHDGIINYIIRIMNDPNALMIDGKNIQLLDSIKQEI